MDTTVNTVETPEHSQIVINGVEYTPEDAQSLVELGNKTRELEKSWNSPIDSLASAYGKSQSELTQLRKERETFQQQIKSFESKQQQGTDTNQDLAQAREAARKLGLTLNEDLEKSGYVKKEDLDSYFDTKQQQQQAVQKVLSEADRLEKEIDGSDGRPKFNKRAVLAYASTYKFEDLTKAYEDMHDGLKEWKQAQIAANQKPGLKTLKVSGGKKEPDEVRPTGDNYKDMLKEIGRAHV